MPSSPFLQRLKERKLVQWALAYLAGAWVLYEVTATVGGHWALPDLFFRGLFVVIFVGFFITLILAWYHGEKGRQRVSGPELLMVATLLVIAGGVLAMLGGDEEVPESTEGVVLAPVQDDRPSIAILPLDNISPNPEDAWFADGMQEEITSRLSKISGLKVISRTSVMRYRDSEARPPAAQIAALLDVDFLLEGSARISGSLVRLTAQLIDARRDAHLWVEEYDRELSTENLFAVQSEIAQRIASSMRALLTPEEQTRIEARPTESLEAYTAYLLGRSLWDQWNEESFRRQIEYYEEAIREDSTFALGYAALGEVLAAALWRFQTFITVDEAHDRALAAVNRALELDDGLAQAHNTLGYIKMTFDWDLPGAEEEFRRAMELNPNLVDSHTYLGCEALAYTHRFDEAIAEMEIAVSLSPLDRYTHDCLNATLFVAGRYDEWHEHHRLMQELFPDFGETMGWFYNVLVAEERWEEVIQWIPESPLAPFAYMGLGRREEALALAARFADGNVSQRMNVCTAIGDFDCAFAAIKESLRARNPNVLGWPNVIPYFGVLRTDPRWADYMRRIGVEDRR